jgi:hypothetical protein
MNWIESSYRHLWDSCLEKMGASSSHNPLGLHGQLQGLLYIFTELD